ncbi:MAG: hypothetical protein LH613_12900 [Chamaesiphon sp.]|nr:hypothetical protein [Chamaesiphon sp.]
MAIPRFLAIVALMARLRLRAKVSVLSAIISPRMAIETVLVKSPVLEVIVRWWRCNRYLRGR